MRFLLLSRRRCLPLLVGAIAWALSPAGFASDHADPMSLNVFKLQEDPEANITDLHAFVADRDGRVLDGQRAPTDADCLVVSLCMRRALLPDDAGGLDLDGYEFRVHLDLDPPVAIYDPARTRDGRDYAATRKALEERIAGASGAERAAAAKELARIVAAHDTDASMQALYGGVFRDSTGIAEDVSLTYRLTLRPDPEGDRSKAQVVLARCDLAGVTGNIRRVGPETPFQAGAINVTAGVFDDPFIFPRFFRKNVVGVVATIPLAQLRRPDGAAAWQGPILLWATTHRGNRQVDHVGRSLRTQLPRFGFLNDKHPSAHVRAITQVHDQPNAMEDILSTFIAPLIAHRHYDSVPDVMVYDLRRPARFPNGRRFEDDVGRALAEAGETLLQELSYAESRQFPRATINDKPFAATFPYLAPRWTKAEIAAAADPGAILKLTLADGTEREFQPPRAPDAAAITPLNFADSVWRSLWQGLALGLVVVGLLLLFTVSTSAARWAVVALVAAGFYLIHPVRAQNAMVAGQAALKLQALLLGAGLLLGLVVAWIYALGRRHGRRQPVDARADRQGIQTDDRQPRKYSLADVRDAMFASPYWTGPWGAADAPPLPQYELTAGRLARGLFRCATYPFLAASRRTLLSHADLRWGADGRGFERLLHPNGMILAGEWTIDAAPAGTAYTGFFAPKSRGKVIARYSTCCTETKGGDYRSLALVAKIYPENGEGRPASLITQEDIGGTVTQSIGEAILTNSPPVTPLARGSGVLAFLLTVVTLTKADEQPAERQLYEIAELGKDPKLPTSCPRFLRLKLRENHPRLGGHADFRHEIMNVIYDRGDAQPRGKLVFDIEVSDEGERVGLLNQRLRGQTWTRIGSLSFDAATVSYNGDFVIHFRHPPWRRNRNDPSSVARGGRGES